MTYDANTEKIQAITKWYKHFGIDHVFTSIESTKPIIKIQPSVVSMPSPKSFSSLEQLRTFIMETDVCGLKKFARNTVFSDGDPSSNIMIIGEAPGESEDIQGKPFVGQSGQLLDNMLKAVGLSRKDTYITNIVFWRPPGNRTPSMEEIVMCMPYVKEHIRLVAPKVLLLLGGVAVRSVLNSQEGISRMRGRKNMYENINVIPTFHPAYLLRSPAQKALAYSDMLLLHKILMN